MGHFCDFNYMKNDSFIMIFFFENKTNQIKSNYYTNIWPVKNIKEKRNYLFD